MPAHVFLRYDMESSHSDSLEGQSNKISYAAQVINREYNKDVFCMSWPSDNEPQFYTLIHGIKENYTTLDEAINRFISIAGVPQNGMGNKKLILNIRDKFFHK